MPTERGAAPLSWQSAARAQDFFSEKVQGRAADICSHSKPKGAEMLRQSCEQIESKYRPWAHSVSPFGQYLLWDSDSPRPLGRPSLTPSSRFPVATGKLLRSVAPAYPAEPAALGFVWRMRHKCRIDRASPVSEKTSRKEYSGFLTVPFKGAIPPTADNFKIFTHGGSNL